MNNLLKLAECRRNLLWVSLIIGMYGRQGYLNRVRIAYELP